MSKKKIIYAIIVIIFCLGTIIFKFSNKSNNKIDTIQYVNEFPKYSGELIIVVDNNNPQFDECDFNSESFIRLSEVDEKKRTQVAFANLCYDFLPNAETNRENVSNVYTTGWSDASYNIISDSGQYSKLYNKSHLIAFSLIGNCGDDIYKNLFTGTHDLNTKGMTRYENDITSYLKENQDKHVLYRVTPIYEGDNLVATGVHMEAESVEDRGISLHYNVFIYNVQEGIEINYATGESKLKDEE